MPESCERAWSRDGVWALDSVRALWRLCEERSLCGSIGRGVVKLQEEKNRGEGEDDWCEGKWGPMRMVREIRTSMGARGRGSPRERGEKSVVEWRIRRGLSKGERKGEGSRSKKRGWSLGSGPRAECCYCCPGLLLGPETAMRQGRREVEVKSWSIYSPWSLSLSSPSQP